MHPFDVMEEFRRLEREAREKVRGVVGYCGSLMNWTNLSVNSV